MFVSIVKEGIRLNKLPVCLMSFFISVFSLSFFSSFLTLLSDGLTHLHLHHLHQAAVSQTWVHAVAFHSCSSSSSPSVHPSSIPYLSILLLLSFLLLWCLFFCLKVFEHQVLTLRLASNSDRNADFMNEAGAETSAAVLDEEIRLRSFH